LKYKSVFSNWTFTNIYFDQIPLQANDFVYADPPYDVEFTAYSKGGFGWPEQIRTAEFLAKHPGPVILSNQATKRIVDLYCDLGYNLLIFDAPRRISCTDHLKHNPDVLALRNLATLSTLSSRRTTASSSCP
jgi:DNA adenine methylase